jgi:hypothetical protein
MNFTRPFIVFALFAASLPAQSNLAANPGFEKPLREGWSLFIPGEAKDKGCTVTNAPGRTGQAAVIESPVATRYALASGLKLTNAGERYRFRVWMKADPSAVALGDTPGAVLRVIFADSKGKDLLTRFALVSGAVMADGGKMEASKVPLPRDWKMLELVIDSPEGVASVNYNLFSWRAKGKIFWDDFSMERVGKEVALSKMN